MLSYEITLQEILKPCSHQTYDFCCCTIYCLGSIESRLLTKSQTPGKAQVSCRMIVQKTYMPCGVRPKNVQDIARRLHVSSATVLRIARTQSCLATIERHAQLQKAAEGILHDGHAFIVGTTEKIYNSQWKNNF